MDYVIPKIKSKLDACFGLDSLKYITLVCIPASSVEKIKARFKNFSEKLYHETGMINGYQHMHVISSNSEKKFGGSGVTPNDVSFEYGYFRGKYVLIFEM